MHSNCDVRNVARSAPEAWEARKTGRLETRAGDCASSDNWERPAMSEQSVFRTRPCSGTSAFNPTNATSVMTQGISTAQ